MYTIAGSTTPMPWAFSFATRSPRPRILVAPPDDAQNNGNPRRHHGTEMATTATTDRYE